MPHGPWKVTTSTAAVRLGGVPPSARLAFDGAADTARFEAYVERCPVPASRSGDIVIMDDLNCHKTARVARLIEAVGAGVRHRPAYSPDPNPIEQLSSKLKRWLRPAAARTVDGAIEAMGEAPRAVRLGDIVGRLGHSGYPVQASTVTTERKPH